MRGYSGRKGFGGRGIVGFVWKFFSIVVYGLIIDIGSTGEGIGG